MKGSIMVQIAVCCVVLSLKLVMAQVSDPCIGQVMPLNASSSEGNIESPGYPSQYEKDKTCRWRITAPYGYHVQLTFIEFNTYSRSFRGTCSTSDSDTLQVYDSSDDYSSKQLGRYCGSYLPATVGSTSRYMYIKFKSSVFSTGFYRIFKMKYKAVSTPPRDVSTCSPFFSSSINSNIKVATSLNTSKYINSPLYPNKYPSKIKCVWYITAMSGRIQLTLPEVKIYSYSYFSSISCSSSGSSTTQDVLTIRDGRYTYSKELKAFCSPQYSTQTITSSGKYMTIMFTSNEDNYYTNPTARFKMQYREIPAEGDSLCSPSNSFYDNNNIRVKASSSTNYIKSPWYPNSYPSNIQCTWYISASSSSKRIELTLSDVKIYNKYSSCSKYSIDKDMLIITDGSSINNDELKRVCSSVSNSTVRSTGRYMTIQFKSNSDDYTPYSSALGFNLKYYEYEPDTSTNVGMIVGIVIGVICGLGFLVCCCWMCKRRNTAGNVHRVPAATTMQSTTMTTSGAPQYPMQTQGGPPATQGSYPAPAGSYPPPGQSSYPPTKGSYPPPNYPPPVNDPVPSEPPPQYPGINAGPSQAPSAFNPQLQGPPQANPPSGGEYPMYSGTQDTKTGGPP